MCHYYVSVLTIPVLRASMANHSCDYNCIVVFDERKLQLRTVKDVQEGEEVRPHMLLSNTTFVFPYVLDLQVRENTLIFVKRNVIAMLLYMDSVRIITNSFHHKIVRINLPVFIRFVSAHPNGSVYMLESKDTFCSEGHFNFYEELMYISVPL